MRTGSAKNGGCSGHKTTGIANDRINNKVRGGQGWPTIGERCYRDNQEPSLGASAAGVNSGKMGWEGSRDVGHEAKFPSEEQSVDR